MAGSCAIKKVGLIISKLFVEGKTKLKEVKYKT